MFRHLPMENLGSRSEAEHETIASRWGRRAILVLAAVFCVVIGTAIGLMLTVVILGHEDVPGATRVGPWRFWPDAGRPDINPYLRARLALTGQIPLAAGEGLAAFAREDDKGKPLQQRCSYRIAGDIPDTLFWTMDAMSDKGAPFENAAQRVDFTSADVLRDNAGQFMIEAAPTARPGNWLPLPGRGSFVLVLRLYGTPLSGGAMRDARKLTFPTITAGRCA